MKLIAILFTVMVTVRGHNPYHHHHRSSSASSGSDEFSGGGSGHSNEHSGSANSFDSNESDLNGGGGGGGVNYTYFPLNFMFIGGSSAYQVEGGWNVDGKGESIWDRYTHTYPGRITGGGNGDTAANSYNLYRDDIAALAKLKVSHYKFSISWTRVFSNGDIVTKNAAGIDYYHRVIDEMIKYNIKPMITIYSWDLPQYLQDLGGWANPLMVDYFAQYADFLFNEYGSKVAIWSTFNNPAEHCLEGYGGGEYPPLIRNFGVGEYLCAHHILLSHARAYRIYKKKYYASQGGKVGINLQAKFYYPLDPNNDNNLAAADRAMQFYTGLFANPIFTSDGDYPAVVRTIVDQNSAAEGRGWSRLPRFSADQINEVRGSADFFGLSYFTSRLTVPATDLSIFVKPSFNRDLAIIASVDSNWKKANSDWLYSVPDGLFRMLLWLRSRYGNPQIVITENGWSDGGGTTDDDRITYLGDHMKSILKARSYGVRVAGYSSYSLVDEFEWNRGYTDKFGLYQIDYSTTTLTRVAKKSCTYFTTVIQTRIP